MTLEDYVRKRTKHFKDNQLYSLNDNFESYCEKLNVYLIDDGNGLENSQFFWLDESFFEMYNKEYIYLYKSKRYYVWYMLIFKKQKIPNTYRKISKSKRKYIKQRDGNKCIICGKIHNLTIDHIFPWSIYHDGSFYNLATLCEDCNGKKSDSIEDSEKIRNIIINNLKKKPYE